MRFTITREQLLAPLQSVSGAVEKRQTLPILSNVLMVVDDSKLSLTATDLEIELKAHVDLEGEFEPGEITVPARKLLDIIKSLGDGESVKIEMGENRLRITTPGSRFNLSTMSANEFPSLEETASLASLSVKQHTLKELIEKTQFAMAQQDVRYYLNGMLFEFTEDYLTSVATDGHRLALCKERVKLELDETVNAIIPRKGVAELGRLLEHSEETITLSLGSNHIKVTDSDYSFTSKLVDGRFPEYEKVLPRNGDKVVIADREVLKESLLRASILCNEKFRGVRFMLSNGQVRLHANNPEQEEAEVEFSVDYQGQDLEIGFNVSYMIDVMNTIKTEQVKLTFIDANSSTLIEEVDGGESMYVVMPMRL
ncbi:DNA polymerase III subunit beta [Kangiella sediminilitoris]|uniref:Beta sliding clamp n=1 Tax=Kangiella sediminilitoris TaxID=1144748 RepID=A0A1B3B7G8_9GAMM|nr:DNA polymerase III subunit beta [Kangiella sediminilitoris]AOE48734.1 DNA polymerase III subunit beta [Kangiella sediminilitoris]